MIKRTQHWDTQEYSDHLKTNANVTFQWGVNDCCMCPANAILAFTGTDIADDFRGKYSTEAEAFALIKSVTGGSTVADAAAWCAAKHGLSEYEHPFMAQRGDLVVVKNGETLIAGIVHLSGRHVVSVSEKGLVRLPITAVVRAWKVGA